MNTKSYRYYFNFFAYFLSFMLIEAFVNVRILETAGSNYVNYVYSIGLLFTAAGFLIQFFHNAGTKSHVTFVTSILACLSLLAFSLFTNITIVIIFSMICLFLVGYIGGNVHEMCTDIIDDKYFNIRLAISMAIAIVIQFILQCINYRYADISLSIILLLVIDFPIFDKIENPTFTDDSSTKQSTISRSLFKESIPYIVLVALMSMILGIEDSIVVYKNATGELALFSYVRLFYALGLICAGFISNYKKGMYLTLFSISSMVLSVISIVFMSADTSSYNISMSIMYFYCGFYVIFLTVKFMYISGSISGFGRIARCISTSIIVLITTLLGTSFTYCHCIILSCLLIIMTLFVSVFTGLLVSTPSPIHTDTSALENNKDIYKEFSEKYSLTERETEVFIKLVDSEDTVMSIAADLNISRRVLQRHISSIYAKTGVQTRSGLIKCLYS